MHIFSNTDVNKDLNPLKLFALEIENTGVRGELLRWDGPTHGAGTANADAPMATAASSSAAVPHRPSYSLRLALYTVTCSAWRP